MITEVEIESFDKSDDLIVTVTEVKKRFVFFGKPKTKRTKYRGSGTVFYKLDTAERCSTSEEAWLSRIWTKFQWDKESASSTKQRD